MKEVATLAGVSLATVSRVVNGDGKVRPDLAEKVREAVALLGYRRDLTATNLRRADRHSASLGLVFDDVANPFHAALLRGVESVARTRGVLPLVGSSDEDPARERELAEAFLARRVDGLIVVPAGSDHSYLRPERDAGVALVFVDRPPAFIDADCVLSDNAGGGYAATAHLIARGHRRIAFLGDQEQIYTAAERLRGHREALFAHGVPHDPALVRMGLHDSGSAAAAVEDMLGAEDPPTAVFSAQNLITIGAIERLRALDAHHRVALVGFDDLTLADAVEPGLTVIAQDPHYARAPDRGAAVRPPRRRRRADAPHRGPDAPDRARQRGDRAMILVGGEALYDLVLQGPTDDLHGHPGGGAFNTARTIGRLAQPVSYLGPLSRDRFGERLLGLLEEDSVGLAALERTNDPTTLALAEVDDDGVARYRFYERGTSAVGLTPEAALASLPDGVRYLHVGTLGLTLEPVATALEAVVEHLAPTALIAVDPNIRPWVIGDADAYRARMRRVLANAHVVKVSEEDLDWLYPDAPHVEAVRELLALGPTLGLLTRGPNGALVVTRTAEVAVPAPRAKVVDTIGAGDAFGGGFLAWWSERGLARDDLGTIDLAVEATAFACLVAARTCSRPGASPPYRSELPSA